MAQWSVHVKDNAQIGAMGSDGAPHIEQMGNHGRGQQIGNLGSSGSASVGLMSYDAGDLTARQGAGQGAGPARGASPRAQPMAAPDAAVPAAAAVAVLPGQGGQPAAGAKAPGAAGPVWHMPHSGESEETKTDQDFAFAATIEAAIQESRADISVRADPIAKDLLVFTTEDDFIGGLDGINMMTPAQVQRMRRAMCAEMARIEAEMRAPQAATADTSSTGVNGSGNAGSATGSGGSGNGSGDEGQGSDVDDDDMELID